MWVNNSPHSRCHTPSKLGWICGKAFSLKGCLIYTKQGNFLCLEGPLLIPLVPYREFSKSLFRCMLIAVAKTLFHCVPSPVLLVRRAMKEIRCQVCVPAHKSGKPDNHYFYNTGVLCCKSLNFYLKLSFIYPFLKYCCQPFYTIQTSNVIW